MSQLRCNRARRKDITLLQVLPGLIQDAAEKKLVMVDGKDFIGSQLDVSPAPGTRSGGVLDFFSERIELACQPSSASSCDSFLLVVCV